MQITLKAARVNAGLSQAETAKKIGVNTQTIARWESGKNDIPVSKFRALCKIYGCKEEEVNV